MKQLQTLDAHGHLDPVQAGNDLISSGCVLAMTLSLEQALIARERRDSQIAWGVGCYPRHTHAQEAFDVGNFQELVAGTAVVGEIGLDSGSRVPIELQLRTFREILQVIAGLPRLVSIHSYRATGLVLQELRRTPIVTPVLHWWTGTAAETSEAVELGCYFSIHPAIARHSKFRTRVPQDRILVESDLGYRDPPAAIPCRIEWAEHLIGQQYKMDFNSVRSMVWWNFARIVRENRSEHLLPEGLVQVLRDVTPDRPLQ